MNRLHIAAFALLSSMQFAGVAHAVVIDMVTVGDPGNANDVTVYGAVADPYQIGKYSVTISQYTDFLNAVAATDAYLLYNANMETDRNYAGISRSGGSGSYTYSVIDNGGNSANRPITYVSWFDAARFANWMQNGQGSGSTETGAYTLVGGQTSGTAPARNPGAQFYIPTEDQWYKAAYYKGGSTNAGYWDFATQSDTPPGNMIGSGANQANYTVNGVYSLTQSTSYSARQNYLTDVGAFTNSTSFYGTFDQSGNVWEWNDLDGTAGERRGLRGGGWGNLAFSLSSSERQMNFPTNDFMVGGGFRLASPVAVPEPSTWVMGLAGIACGGWQMWRRQRARSATLRSLPYLFAKVITISLALSILLHRSSCAREIHFSDFSGNESVVDGAFYGGTIAPGVRMYGGKEGVVYHWSANSSYWPQSSDYPFSSSPTDGDPAGFNNASGTGYLSTFLPPGGYYWPLGLTFSFSEMIQRPNRVGLLAANLGSAPYYNNIGVSLTLEGGRSSYYEYGPGRRLLAFQEEVGIIEMNLRWSPLITKADGPRIQLDDLRYETVAVPEPSTYAMALAGLACGGCSMWRRRMRCNRASTAATSLTLAAVFFCATNADAQVTLDWVTVGDPGNTADTTGAPRPAGAVLDSFQIMKYEFTNQQYTAFLNSVAKTNTYAFYDARMGQEVHGGITQSGASGSYTYATRTNMGDKPVNYVSWFDAARVCNWLQNGQGPGSTETGAYTLVGGQTSGTAPARNSGATFYIPTEDQWYKAAYYKGGSTNAGYWDYATQSDADPTAVTAGSTGIGSSGSTGNFANYNGAAVWNGDVRLTTVGTNGGPSAYGAFDMSGNMTEWNDLAGAAGSSRGLRGGFWFSDVFPLSSSYSNSGLLAQGSFIGFRLASPVAVPEPSTKWSLMALATICLAATRRRRAKASLTQPDAAAQSPATPAWR
jgi:formylglycine-generating enzyme required for sulfatase activity